MLFGFGNLLAVLAAVHPEVGEDIVEARLKYLQRLPFPAEHIKVGKGGRANYSADDLMKLVVAFELLAVGIVPAQAAGIVAERWSKLSPDIADAWVFRSNPIESILLLARIDGFDTRRGNTGTAEVFNNEDLLIWRKQRDLKDRRAVVVDLLAMARALAKAFETEKPVVQNVAMLRDLEAWVSERRRARVRTGT